MTSSIFALLPTELIRMVLEFSAQESSQTAARLLRVSKVVNEWVQPLLHETFVLNMSTLERFFVPHLNTTSSSADDTVLPPRSFAPRVRNMCINFADTSDGPAGYPYPLKPNYLHMHNAGNSKQDVHDFIKACIHLSNVYLDIGLDDFRPHVDIVDGLPGAVPAQRLPSLSISTTLTHLHCATWESWLFTSRFLELLTALTHLRLDVTYDTSIFRTFRPIVHRSSDVLPNLTHFAIGADSRSGGQQLRATANLARTILRRQRVHMVVISAWYCWDSTSEGIQQAFLGAADDAEVVMHEKVCILGMGGSLDGRISVEEWENEARGKKGIWSRAQEVLDVQARSKETEGQGIAIGFRELIV